MINKKEEYALFIIEFRFCENEKVFDKMRYLSKTF